ncbi:hypothetical protein [Budvicia diplopodorum]|nr:hypothetical protein [Budvicia diplopodorum]
MKEVPMAQGNKVVGGSVAFSGFFTIKPTICFGPPKLMKPCKPRRCC